MTDQETAEFDDVTCLSETAKAILVSQGPQRHWVPKSQVHDDSEVWKQGDTGKLVITLWFAEKEGLFE